jgi:hypothetical protein
MENNQEIPLPKGYTQVSNEESVPLPKGYTEVLDETVPDVKKKEQTKPTQAAPLPGLGGVSEQPTPSPSVGVDEGKLLGKSSFDDLKESLQNPLLKSQERARRQQAEPESSLNVLRTEKFVPYTEENLEDEEYKNWKSTLPENLQQETEEYDLYGAYKAGMEPIEVAPGEYHLSSRDPKTGRILKSEDHDTFYNSVIEDDKLGYVTYKSKDGNIYSKKQYEIDIAGDAQEIFRVDDTGAIVKESVAGGKDPVSDVQRGADKRKLDLEVTRDQLLSVDVKDKLFDKDYTDGLLDVYAPKDVKVREAQGDPTSIRFVDVMKRDQEKEDRYNLALNEAKKSVLQDKLYGLAESGDAYIDIAESDLDKVMQSYLDLSEYTDKKEGPSILYGKRVKKETGNIYEMLLPNHVKGSELKLDETISQWVDSKAEDMELSGEAKRMMKSQIKQNYKERKRLEAAANEVSKETGYNLDEVRGDVDKVVNELNSYENELKSIYTPYDVKAKKAQERMTLEFEQIQDRVINRVSNSQEYKDLLSEYQAKVNSGEITVEGANSAVSQKINIMLSESPEAVELQRKYQGVLSSYDSELRKRTEDIYSELQSSLDQLKGLSKQDEEYRRKLSDKVRQMYKDEQSEIDSDWKKLTFGGLITTEKDTKLGRGIRSGMGDLAASIAGGVEYLVGENTLSEKLASINNQIKSDNPMIDLGEFGFEEFAENPFNEDWWATRVAPSAPLTFSLMVPGIGVGAGTTALATRVGLTGLSRALVTGTVSGIGMRAMESFTEAGLQYYDLIERGESVDYASKQAAKTYSENMDLLSLDVAEMTTFFLPASSRIATMAKFVAQVPMNAAEELLQERLPAEELAYNRYLKGELTQKETAEGVSEYEKVFSGGKFSDIYNFLQTNQGQEVALIGSIYGGAFGGASLPGDISRTNSLRRLNNFLNEEIVRYSSTEVVRNAEGKPLEFGMGGVVAGPAETMQEAKNRRIWQLKSTLDEMQMKGLINEDDAKLGKKQVDFAFGLTDQMPINLPLVSRGQLLQKLTEIEELEQGLEGITNETLIGNQKKKIAKLKNESEEIIGGTAQGYFINNVSVTKEQFAKIASNSKFAEGVINGEIDVTIMNDADTQKGFAEAIEGYKTDKESYEPTREGDTEAERQKITVEEEIRPVTDNPALKDVESTAQAFKDAETSEVVDDIAEAFGFEIKQGVEEKIAKAYHKAKADGTNPELVKAVEQSLKEPPVAEKPQKAEPKTEEGKPKTEPVSAPTEVAEEAAIVEEKERGFFGKILDKLFKYKKIEEDVQITEEQKEQGIQEIYDEKVKRIEDNIKKYQETGNTILENLYREQLEILKSESPRQYLERDLEVLKGMPNYYSEKASKKDAVSYNKQVVQESVDRIYQTEKLLGITATEQEVKERQDIINSTPTRTELEAQQDTVPVAETPVEETVSESETNKEDATRKKIDDLKKEIESSEEFALIEESKKFNDEDWNDEISEKVAKASESLSKKVNESLSNSEKIELLKSDNLSEFPPVYINVDNITEPTTLDFLPDEIKLVHLSRGMKEISSEVDFEKIPKEDQYGGGDSMVLGLYLSNDPVWNEGMSARLPNYNQAHEVTIKNDGMLFFNEAIEFDQYVRDKYEKELEGVSFNERGKKVRELLVTDGVKSVLNKSFEGSANELIVLDPSVIVSSKQNPNKTGAYDKSIYDGLTVLPRSINAAVESKKFKESNKQTPATATKEAKTEKVSESETNNKSQLKPTQDAIQEQATGEVPVQPEAKAGEKVEEGKPKTEPEKPTQEGKEVSEEEKVKAAKDNLNSVWEKWKQSQNNLGIVFDAKSKANEDMELLEAFLTYIKALGINTAKDIQKAFNDFTGGEATLDDVGAEFIANKVNPKKGETNYEKTEDMNRKDLSKRGKSLFNAAKKLFMDFRRTFVKFSSDTRELLKSTTDIRPVYDYFVARLGSPGNANLIFQEAKKKIYDGIFPNLRKHLDSLIKYRRIITINESRVESNRKGLGSLKASEIFEKAGDEAVNAFNEAVSVANDYANSTEQQALDARGIRNEALRSLRQSEWYKSLSELKQKRFEKQLREDLGFLKNENFTGKDSNGNPIGLSVAREMLSEIEVVVGKKDFNKINERAELYFDEFKKMLEKDLKKGIISQEQYDAMIGKDYSPRVFIQHMFGFDGEFIENIDEARLMKEYSLSSDAIRTLREGLKDLNTNEAYWELITDSEKLLAGYISSRERRYAFNDLNKKMVSVLSKFEAEFNELKKKDKLTKEERLRYKKLGNILDAFSTERKRGMSSANYYENGEKKSFYIRDDIFKQWYDMRSTVRPDGTATKLLDNLFQIPQRILQSFATGEAAPFFFVFNTARDFVQLSVISDVYGNWTFTPISMAKAMKDFAKGAYHIFMDDALYREAMENGVGMDFLYMEKGIGLRKMMKDSLLKLAEKSDITRVGSMALTKGLDAMSSGLTAANRYSELGFRIAIYERVRDAEYKKIEAAKDKMTDEEYLEAKQDARKKAAAVSRDFMNFSEGGSLTKKVNPYASYLNAAVIGTDTVVKEFRKNPPAFTFRVAQGTAVLSTAMLGMGLMMLNMFDEDDDDEGDDKDKQYGTLKKYYKILDSVNPYYRNKFYIIPTGRKDENGNYQVIRIAKNPALIAISYAAEKALRYNLEKKLLGSEDRYSSEDLEKDALEINYLFHEYLMPINLSPVDKNGKVQDTGVILSSLVQKNIPLSLMMIAMTGYDPYTNRYISPEKKYQSELDSKYLIGWNDPEIQGFYKDMAMELNTSITPKEMKVMVEKVITRPENNPIIASVYSMLDRNNKTSDIIKKDRSLVSDILNMTKKVAVISADYGGYAKKPKTKKIEQKIREHKEEKYATSKIPKTVVYDIIKKVKNKEIDALDIDTLVSEMDKMVSTQIDVFKEANVEISEKDEMEIRHKVYRNAVPALNLPELPTQYKLTYVVDRDPVVMAYRFFEDFGDFDVQGDQFKEISAQMMNEYRGQYNSVMSKDKFNKFLTKYIEAKNDPELIGN